LSGWRWCSQLSAVADTPCEHLVNELHGQCGQGRTESLREQCQEQLGHCASYMHEYRLVHPPTLAVDAHAKMGHE